MLMMSMSKQWINIRELKVGDVVHEFKAGNATTSIGRSQKVATIADGFAFNEIERRIVNLRGTYTECLVTRAHLSGLFSSIRAQ